MKSQTLVIPRGLCSSFLCCAQGSAEGQGVMRWLSPTIPHPRSQVDITYMGLFDRIFSQEPGALPPTSSFIIDGYSLVIQFWLLSHLSCMIHFEEHQAGNFIMTHQVYIPNIKLQQHGRHLNASVQTLSRHFQHE